jgi:hypothetical protein
LVTLTLAERTAFRFGVISSLLTPELSFSSPDPADALPFSSFSSIVPFNFSSFVSFDFFSKQTN